MATERLIVKNFGPIQEADLDLRKVTVLIGEQASGKSVLAKLVSLCYNFYATKNWEYWTNPRFNDLSEMLEHQMKENFETYGFESMIESTTFIDFKGIFSECFVKNGKYFYKFESSKLIYLSERVVEIMSKISVLEEKKHDSRPSILSADEELMLKVLHEELRGLQKELLRQIGDLYYVPAERSLLTEDGGYGGANEYIHQFGDQYHSARRYLKKINLKLLEIDFESDDEWEVSITDKNKVKIPIWKASTGIQSMAPLIVTIEAVNPYLKHLFIIEEPELNLYPTTQKKLVEYLVEKCTKGDNRLIITTHSPYILTALNNCIEASNVLKTNPEAKAEVDKLVPPESQIAYEDVAAYFVANGTAKSIMNEEYQIIDANALDDVSDELSRVHGELLDLKYQHQD